MGGGRGYFTLFSEMNKNGVGKSVDETKGYVHRFEETRKLLDSVEKSNKSRTR